MVDTALRKELMYNVAVLEKFKELTKDNEIPRFMCTKEYDEAVAYAKDLEEKDLLTEMFERWLNGTL